MPIQEGTIIADRFVICELIGTGGMGAIYRAIDNATGDVVAVKLLRRAGMDDSRFTEEAKALAAISRPTVVRYFAHGTTIDTGLFLVMEWLDGEDLCTRLVDDALTLGDTLALADRIADALAAVHATRIVHRDIKPSNIFLVDNQPSKAKLIDFGLARRDDRSRRMTRTGAVIGTASYMAPEQATGTTEIDARVDVFALGCVLFECLTGAPPFGDGPPMAVLARIMWDEPLPLRELRPDLSVALEQLVLRMLAKDPNDRPANGAEVQRELSLLDRASAGPPSAVARPRQAALTTDEQRIVGIVLGDVDDPAAGLTPTPLEFEKEIAIARKAVEAAGGDAVRLGSGALLVTVSGAGSATDLAARAADSALALRRVLAKYRLAVVTGRADTADRWPAGPAIDRAALLLDQARAVGGGPVIDDVTAGLLGGRFSVLRHGEALVLLGKRDEADETRTLLGKVTPCVGRDKELALIEATFDECVTDSVARAVVVIAPAGFGKTKLRREVVSRLTRWQSPLVLTARAEAVGGGSALRVVRQLVRSSLTLGHPLRAGLLERMRSVSALDAGRIADFLVEIADGAVDSPGPELRAARNDARLMREGAQRSFREWLAIECGRAPVLAVIEDLHWGDVASVWFLEEVLRGLADRPLLVVAFGRPELDEQFPRLWETAGAHTIRLRRLTNRAAAQLVREVLPAPVAEEALERIIERADGHPFYLEELIRAVAEGRDDELPETVLAMVLSRLERVAPEARRVLRAASVFGDEFWADGVDALLGGPAAATRSGDWLPDLVSRELVKSVHGVQRAGQPPMRFCHALVREAAYGTLTEADRVKGHRLAAAWLEAVGEREPLVVAEHWECGQAGERAVPFLLRAARAALDGGNAKDAFAFTERAIAFGANGGVLGALRHIQAAAHARLGQWERAVESARDAIELIPEAETSWFSAASVLAFASTNVGDAAGVVLLLGRIQTLTAEPKPTGPFGASIVLLANALFHVGQGALALQLCERLERVEASDPTDDPSFNGWLWQMRSARELYMPTDIVRGLAAASKALELFRAVGERSGEAQALLHLSYHLIELGSYERAVSAAEQAGTLAREAGVIGLLPFVVIQSGRANAFARRLEAARARRAELEALGGSFTAQLLAILDAELAVIEGRLDDAATRARTLEAEHAPFTGSKGWVHALLARVALAQGCHDDALSLAERGLSLEADCLAFRDGSILRLVRAEALAGLGRTEDARHAIAEARARLDRVCSALDEELVAGFRSAPDAHARTLELAKVWLSR